MLKIFLTVTAILAITGCAKTYYTNPSNTRANFDIDKAACANEAERNVPITSAPQYVSPTAGLNSVNCNRTGPSSVNCKSVPNPDQELANAVNQINSMTGGTRNIIPYVKNCLVTKGWVETEAPSGNNQSSQQVQPAASTARSEYSQAEIDANIARARKINEEKDRAKASARRAVSGKFIWPTNSVSIVSSFSPATKGIDISGNVGDSVIAVAGGKVMYASNGVKGFGNLIVIDHGDGYFSAYGHNEKILVNNGQQVTQGMQIATLGKTESRIPQLHFELREKGTPVDPLPYLTPQTQVGNNPSKNVVPPVISSSDAIKKLKELKSMVDQGLITKQDYETKKQAILKFM